MASASRYLPFAVVGAIGFLVDGGLLTLLVNGLGWGHYPARAVSFAVAVTVTWLGNRRWVFRSAARAAAEYRAYFLVQGMAAVLNLGIYVTLIEALPALARVPIVPLAGGAAIALVFNFVASSRWVFGRRRPEQVVHSERTADACRYSGRDNLQAMQLARNYNRHLQKLVDHNVMGHRILDFGAGTGEFARELAAPGRNLVCLEPDPELRAELVAKGLTAIASLADARPAEFDSVYSLNVLEHVADDRAALVGLRERLKEGGRLVLYVPAFELLFSAMDEKVGHFRRYRRRPLAEAVERAGFEILCARYVDSLGFLVTLVYKAIGSRSGNVGRGAVVFFDRYVFPVSLVLDRACSAWFGKNLLLVAQACSTHRHDPGSSSPARPSSASLMEGN